MHLDVVAWGHLLEAFPEEGQVGRIVRWPIHPNNHPQYNAYAESKLGRARDRLVSALARSKGKVHEIDEAREHIAYAVELDPNYADGWVLVGDIARQSGDNATALEAYKTALALKPALTTLQPIIDSLSSSGSVSPSASVPATP